MMMMKLRNFTKCTREGNKDMQDGLMKDSKGRDVLKQSWVWKIENNESRAELLQI